MTQHCFYPEEIRTNQQNHTARHLLKELKWLEERTREMACEKPLTTSGEIEHKVICTVLAQRIRRIKAELRRGEKDVPEFFGGAGVRA